MNELDKKQFIFEVLKKQRDQLLRMGVSTIGIFGSVVRNEATELSDYDILVEFDENHHNYKCFNQLCDLIDKNIGENYDLITRQSLSPYMGKTILQEVEYVDLTS